MKRSFTYLFFETLPGFFFGTLVFVLILLMAQMLRLTEFFLIHDIPLQSVGLMIVYLSVSFLSVLMPMALLFAVVMSYSRLSQDSEMVAMRALGYSSLHLLLPALLLGTLVTILSFECSFKLAPWGNRQFEVMVSELGRKKAISSIKEASFSEGFFNLVVYAQKVDHARGELQDIFIYDERDPKSPLTIVARSGQVKESADRLGPIILNLRDGDIHRKTQSHTKIKFSEFQVLLSEGAHLTERSKSLQSLDYNELKSALHSAGGPSLSHLIEWHKRWILASACLLFSFVGMALGTVLNRRTPSNGFVTSIAVVLSYWVLYLIAESSVRAQGAGSIALLWLPNVLFLGFGIYRYFKISKMS